jgi:hypothetical protein
MVYHTERVVAILELLLDIFGRAPHPSATRGRPCACLKKNTFFLNIFIGNLLLVKFIKEMFLFIEIIKCKSDSFYVKIANMKRCWRIFAMYRIFPPQARVWPENKGGCRIWGKTGYSALCI